MNIKHIILLLVTIKIYFCKVKRIFNLTENEFIEVSKATENTNLTWLMVFYTNDYHSYDKFMDLLKEDIYSHYKKNKNVKFGLVDCKSNTNKWLVNILDIKSIPYLFLISNGSMYHYKYPELSQENIIKFVDEKHSPEESFPIPERINIFTKVKIMYNMIVSDLNEHFQGLLDKYNINFKWNSILTLIVMGILMLIFFIIELYLINCCCMRFFARPEDYGEINENNNINDKNNKEENKDNKKDKIE
jgi:hypothetical protein